MNDNKPPLYERLLLLLLNGDGKLVSGSTTGYLLGGALLADGRWPVRMGHLTSLNVALNAT